jgi:hypothetical protein
VIRFWNNDVLSETDAVVRKILEALASRRRRVPANHASSHPLPDPPHKGEGIG